MESETECILMIIIEEIEALTHTTLNNRNAASYEFGKLVGKSKYREILLELINTVENGGDENVSIKDSSPVTLKECNRRCSFETLLSRSRMVSDDKGNIRES